MTTFGLLLTVMIGAGFGVGVVMAIAGLRPAKPTLTAVLANLGTQLPATTRRRQATTSWISAIGSRLAIPRMELALLGRTVEGYIALKVGCVLFGIALPTLLGFAAALVHVAVPIYVPAAAALGLGALFYVVVDVDIRQKAGQARREWRYAVCSFLDLVALERAAGRAPGESLERAAMVGTGWVFERIQLALTEANVAHRPPWDALRDISDELGVPALGSLSELMQLSGEEGANSYESLSSLAKSLRAEILAEEQASANSVTTVLSVPTAALLLVLFALAVYPMLDRLLAT